MQSQNSISFNRNSSLPLTTCPECQMTWLTPGLSHGDVYECKNCGFSFTIGSIPEDLLPSTGSDEEDFAQKVGFSACGAGGSIKPGA